MAEEGFRGMGGVESREKAGKWRPHMSLAYDNLEDRWGGTTVGAKRQQKQHTAYPYN
jgi:hypothetical protein